MTDPTIMRHTCDVLLAGTREGQEKALEQVPNHMRARVVSELATHYFERARSGAGVRTIQEQAPPSVAPLAMRYVMRFG